MTHPTAPHTLSMPARFEGSYHSALELYRDPSSGRLGSVARLCAMDALHGELRAKGCPHKLGIGGLSLVSADVFSYMLTRANAHGFVWFARGMVEIQERTGHGEHAVRQALREITGEASAGPRILQLIRGRAVAERIYQLLDIPLMVDARGPVRRAPGVRGSSAPTTFASIVVTVENVR